MVYKPYKPKMMKLQTFSLTDHPKFKPSKKRGNVKIRNVKIRNVKTRNVKGRDIKPISPFWDSDKDGVSNFLDCRPHDSTKQDLASAKKKIMEFAVTAKKKSEPVVEEFKKRGKVAGKEIYYGLAKKVPKVVEEHAVEMGWIGPKKPQMEWDEELGEWVEVTQPGYTVGPGIRESVREGIRVDPGAMEELKKVPSQVIKVVRQVGERATEQDVQYQQPREPSYPMKAQQKRPWYPYKPISKEQSFFHGFGDKYKPVTKSQSFFRGHSGPPVSPDKLDWELRQELLRRKKKSEEFR